MKVPSPVAAFSLSVCLLWKGLFCGLCGSSHLPAAGPQAPAGSPDLEAASERENPGPIRSQSSGAREAAFSSQGVGCVDLREVGGEGKISCRACGSFDSDH